jgi:hypothetical protein
VYAEQRNRIAEQKKKKKHTVAARFIHYTNRRETGTVLLCSEELNPSVQRCLPRFFTGDFNF